jgi:hypothetical protein
MQPGTPRPHRMPFFKNVFRSKDSPRSGSKVGEHEAPVVQPKPRWEESWSRKEVAPAEIQELIHGCTQEMKSRGTSPAALALGSHC